ncbi:MAG TPA: hypothetical protein PK157_21150 [Bryobacteraceae bacterium]|nr:hypothetical protein [Bryobacteraceae bacterium]
MLDSYRNYSVATLISLLLIGEVLRKYIYHSNIVLATTELLAIIVATALWVRIEKYFAIPLSVAIGALIVWKLVTIAIGHQDPALGLIGLRSFLVPCAFLIIGLAIHRALGWQAAASIINRTFTIWFLVIGVVMVLQLIAGRDHWINALPEGFGDERAGIGDYTVGDVGIEFLFRPTSIFLHTGKAGATLAVLTIYRLYHAVSTGKTLCYISIGVSLDVAILLLSGQRAALIAYTFAALCLLLFQLRKWRIWKITVVSLLIGVFIIALPVAVSRNGESSVELTISKMMLLRAASVIEDIPYRLSDNVIEPFLYVWDQFAFSPAGVGAFSLGASVFGGTPLYEIVPIGTAENSWLRMLAEEGVVGLLGACVFWGCMTLWPVYALTRGHRRVHAGGQRSIERRQIDLLCSTIVLALLLLWSNTHDILGNTLVMGLGALLFGAVAAPLKRHGVSRSVKNRL